MVTKLDYNEQMVQAAHAVLLELVHVLGEYREGIALVGGWVPGLLLPEDADEHVGSLDVDIALDHKLLEEAGYETICEKLESRGYSSQIIRCARLTPSPKSPLQLIGIETGNEPLRPSTFLRSLSAVPRKVAAQVMGQEARSAVWQRKSRNLFSNSVRMQRLSVYQRIQ